MLSVQFMWFRNMGL